MDRRRFVHQSLLTTVAISAVPLISVAKDNKTLNRSKFKLKFAPHDGMFKYHAGPDIIDQIQFMADQGFTAFEDNEMRNRPLKTQEAIANILQDNAMEMGVFVAHKIYWKEANLASGNKEYRDEFLKDIQNSIEVAKRVNARWITIVPGHVDLRQDNDYQTSNVIETLKRAADILAPHGLIMVLEPLNFRNHPGMFLTESPQAYQICKAVNSPSCKILFDIYHQQIQEGNLIPNIESCWDEIAYFQIGDNPGRNEPTTGEINYTNIFKYIHNKGYTGILGMEHGNSMDGKAGEIAVIEAYKKSEDF
jgi:hydroxypyruvate isomerase